MPLGFARLIPVLLLAGLLFLLLGGWRWLKWKWEEWRMSDRLAEFGNFMYNKKRHILIQWIWLILIIILIIVAGIFAG